VAPANSSPIRVFLKPGAVWRYSGGGYCIVQQMLLDATGEDFPTLLRERVLAQAGMTASTFAQPLPAELAPHAAAGHDGNGGRIAGDAHVYPELAAAGLWTTSGDLAKFALALAHSLTAAGEPKLMAQATAETMITVPLAGSDYGLGLGVKGTGDNVSLSHSGANEGFRAQLVIFPRRGVGAVIMTNGENGGAVANELLRGIARAYQWPDYQPETVTAFPLKPEAFEEFVGRYERDDTVMLFYRKDDHFYLRMTNRPRREIFAKSKHEFFEIYGDDTYDFQQDEVGHVTHVIRRAEGTTQVYPRVQGEQE
jgi:CubicO group peptidase (beta-lactamase class C family)